MRKTAGLSRRHGNPDFNIVHHCPLVDPETEYRGDEFPHQHTAFLYSTMFGKLLQPEASF